MAELTTGHNIAVFTGSRAEYGLLRHLIAAIAAEPDMKLQLIVCGSHLSEGQGRTVKEIEDDGIEHARVVPLNLDGHKKLSMAVLSAEAMAGVGHALESLRPQLMIVLGDRYETFAAAAASHLMGVPVVHLHGGESTEGAVDDRLRHAISQLSSWHFTAAEHYRQRVISMGNTPERVINVGPMVLDGILTAPRASRGSFEQDTGFSFGNRNLIVTYHPETLLQDRGVSGFEALLAALERVQCQVLFTHPNADTGSEELVARLQEFVQRHPGRSWAIPSLGHQRYLAALQLFEAMAGNSSSGVIEAPLLGMPVVNIGARQSGRLRYGVVNDVTPVPEAIANGLEQALEAGQRTYWPRQLPLAGSSPTATIMTWLRAGEWR